MVNGNGSIVELIFVVLCHAVILGFEVPFPALSCLHAFTEM